MFFTSPRVVNVQMKRLMELSNKKKSELNKCINDIEMHSTLGLLHEYVNELPAPDSSLRRSDMLKIYDIRCCFKGLYIYFDFVTLDAQKFANAALAKREKKLAPEGGELQRPRPFPSDTSFNISIPKPEKKPRLNLISTSKDLREVKDICAELKSINLIEEPRPASSSLTPRKKEEMITFGDADAFQSDSLWLDSFSNGHPMQREKMSDFGDVDTFHRDSLLLESLTNGHPIQDTIPAVPLIQAQPHEEPMNEEQALISRLEELGFTRIDRAPETQTDTPTEKERPKAKSDKKVKPIIAGKPQYIKNIFRRNTLLVGDLEDRQLSIRQQLMKVADVDDDWPEEDVIDTMRFPIDKRFISFDVYTPQSRADQINQKPDDFESDLVRILDPPAIDEPMQVTQFPDDDLLMAAKSRATGSLPLIFDTRPSYVDAVSELGPVQVLETSRLDISHRIGKSMEQRIWKSTLQRIEEAWKQNGDPISFTTIWPKNESSKLAAAIIFQDLLDLWKKKEIVLSQTSSDPDDIFIERPH